MAEIGESLPRNFVVHAFDVEIHAQDLAGVKTVAALALHRLAVLIGDRTLERMQRAGPDGGFRIHRHLLYVVGHVGIGRHHDHSRIKAAPGVFGGPFAVERGLGALGVIVAPIVGIRRELGFRPELDHVGRFAEGVDAALLRNLHGGRRIGVLRQHVDALVYQRLGGVGFLARIEPAVYPDDLDLHVRIDRLRAKHRRVDVGDDLGDRKRDDVADHARLRDLGCDLALDVAPFIEAGGIGAHILRALEAGGVFEEHVRVFVRHLYRRVHEAERGGEDELVAGPCQLLDRAFGVGALGNVLEISGLDLAGERLFHGLAADVVLVTPAEIADRSRIDETDFQLFGSIGTAERRGRDRQDRGHGDDVPFLHDFTPGWKDGAYSPFEFPHVRSARRACSRNDQRSGTKTTPRDAGAADPAMPRVREINTRTMTVAR